MKVLPGTRVSVRFGDGNWYAGTVLYVKPGQWATCSFDDDGTVYTVQFPDEAFRLLDDPLHTLHACLSRELQLPHVGDSNQGNDGKATGDTAASSTKPDKNKKPETIEDKTEDHDDDEMLEEGLEEVSRVSRKRIRQEQGGARERAEARMVEAALRASMEAASVSVEEAQPHLPYASLLVSSSSGRQTAPVPPPSVPVGGGTAAQPSVASAAAEAALVLQAGYGPSTAAVLAEVAGLVSWSAVGECKRNRISVIGGSSTLSGVSTDISVDNAEVSREKGDGDEQLQSSTSDSSNLRKERVKTQDVDNGRVECEAGICEARRRVEQ
eukprot:2904113-Rhodomonas_salina.1